MLKKIIKTAVFCSSLLMIVLWIVGIGFTPAIAQEKVVLRFAWPTGGEIPTEAIVESIKEFEALNPSISVKEILQPKDTYEDIGLKTMIAGGNIPDLYYLNGGKWKVQQYALFGGYCEDLTKYLHSDFGPFAPGDWGYNFLPIAINYDRIYGRRYLIPYVGSSGWMWYNKDIFEEGGLSVPKTWPQLLDTCAKLKSKGIIPISVANKEGWPMANWAGQVVQRVAGSLVYDSVFSRKEGYNYTHPGFVQGLSLISGLIEKGYINEGANGLTIDEGAMLLFMRKAAIHPIGSWFPIVATENAPANFHYGVFATPAVPEGKGDPTSVQFAPNGWVVGKGSPHANEAVELLKYLTSVEVQKRWVREKGLFSVIKGTITPETAPHPSLIKIYKLLLEAGSSIGWPDETYGYDIIEPFEDAVARVLEGVSPEAALEKAEKIASEIK